MKRTWISITTIALVSTIMVFDTGIVAKASGWTEKEDGWYYEEDGQYAADVWKKGEKGFYYLDQTGRLSTDTWVDDGEKKYYVDVQGLRVKNQWVFTDSWEESGDDSQHWYYFDGNGKMVTGKQEIGDKKYFFDEEGKMLTGWITYRDGQAEELTEEISGGDTYYCQEDGVRVSGWHQLAPPADEENTGEEYWYNFEGNGKLRRNTKTKIGDYDFCFDEQGRMIEGWAYKTVETNAYVQVDDTTQKELLDHYNQDFSRYYYCGEKGVGVVQKNIWLKIVPPGKEGDPDEGEKWYYFDTKGKLYSASKASPSEASPSEASRMTTARKVKTVGEYGLKGGGGDLLHVILKRVNGKYYIFDSNGQIVDGLIYIYNTDGTYPLKEGYYYFGTATSRTTGKVKKEEDGTEYQYLFAKKFGDGYSEGQGVTGIYNGVLYYKGLAVTAGDDLDYKVVYIPELAGDSGTGMFLVDRDGKVKTGGVTKKLDDGSKYKVKSKRGSRKSGFIIYRVEDGTQEDVPLQAEDADETLDFDEPELV